jgi:hypothetical protein
MDNTEEVALFHPRNVAGAPLTTVGGLLLALAQYLMLNGDQRPHDLHSWLSFGLGAVVAVTAALLRDPRAR